MDKYQKEVTLEELAHEENLSRPEGDIYDWSNPHFVFTPKKIHSWIQRGFELHCNSCDLEHGVFLRPDQLLTGIDENGQPVFSVRE